jgi:hypothetical protein
LREKNNVRVMIYIFHAKNAAQSFFILYHAGAGEVASYATTGERRGWTIHPPPPLRSSPLSQGDSPLSLREKQNALIFISLKGHNYNGERAFICAFPLFCAFFFIILRLEIREYIIYILI